MLLFLISETSLHKMCVPLFLRFLCFIKKHRRLRFKALCLRRPSPPAYFHLLNLFVDIFKHPGSLHTLMSTYTTLVDSHQIKVSKRSQTLLGVSAMFDLVMDKKHTELYHKEMSIQPHIATRILITIQTQDLTAI